MINNSWLIDILRLKRKVPYEKRVPSILPEGALLKRGSGPFLGYLL
jgi:hypothetical protein